MSLIVVCKVPEADIGLIMDYKVRDAFCNPYQRRQKPLTWSSSRPSSRSSDQVGLWVHRDMLTPYITRKLRFLLNVHHTSEADMPGSSLSTSSSDIGMIVRYREFFAHRC